METFSALLALCAGNSPVTGEFPAQRPVMRSFDVFFDLCLNKWLGKQSWGWWFETPSCSLWRHCNELRVFHVIPFPYGETMIPTLWYTLCYKSRITGEYSRHLTHLPDKMAATLKDGILKRIFPNEILECRFNFHWSLFLRAQLIISQNWFR